MTTRTAADIEILIAENSKLLDKTPYAHNIIAINLQILETNHGYTDEQIKAIIVKNKLNKKGWGHLLNKK